MAASASQIHPYAQHLGVLNPVGIGRLEVEAQEREQREQREQRERRLSGASSSESKGNGKAGMSLSPTQSGSVSTSTGTGATLRAVSSGGMGHGRRPKSVDLSQLYLGGEKDVRFTSTNETIADESHKIISGYLGNDSAASLLSRQKTIEMYKENVKKSKNPDVLFQYSQYMLQTALTMSADTAAAAADSGQVSGELSVEEQRQQFLKEALHYLKKLSVKGYKDAQYLLGDSYSSGVFGKVNQKEAFVLFQASAKHGHIEAAYRTSICYEEGLGTKRDSRKCIEFLKFAASRNHPAAMFKLGVYAFYAKMGLPDDIITKKNGLKWLSRAAAKANRLTCAAPYELAKIYETGFLDILIADKKYAMELYVQAASLGHMPSATLLGRIYETGNEIVPQDTVLSVNYYTIASHGGDPEAMMGLCAWYLIGAEPAFAADDKEAFEWALKAARLGFPKAQFTVGYFYEKGKGVEPNEEKAAKWYRVAADNKDPRALNKLKMSDRATRKARSLSTFNFSFLMDQKDDKTDTKSFHLNLDDQNDEDHSANSNANANAMNHRRYMSAPVDALPQQYQSTTPNVPESAPAPGHVPGPGEPSLGQGLGQGPGTPSTKYNTNWETPEQYHSHIHQKSLDQHSQKTPNLKPLSMHARNSSQANSSDIFGQSGNVRGKANLNSNSNTTIKEGKEKGKAKNKDKKGCVIM